MFCLMMSSKLCLKFLASDLLCKLRPNQLQQYKRNEM
jgi:hypothetical protein